MSNALVKINKEAKRLKKLHPNKHRDYAGFRKEATAKYHAGTIGKRKKSKPKKRKAVHRKRPAHKKRAAKMGAVRRRKKSTHRKKNHRPHKRMGKVSRRQGSNGGGGMSTNKILLLGGLALGAYLLLKPKDTTPKLPYGSPPLVTTTNPVRNTQANDILTYAAAGGLAIDAIIKLITALNNSSDNDVKDIYDNIQGGGGIPSGFIA